MSAFNLVEMAGVRIVEVVDLEPPVIFVRAHGIALVAAELDEPYRRAAADALLVAACGGPLARSLPRPDDD